MKNYVSKVNIQNEPLQKTLQIESKYFLKMSTQRPPNNSEYDQDSGAGVAIDDRIETKEPQLYKVIILNDDYTPMDFVIYVLKHFFLMDVVTAEKVMLDVHQKGSGVAGVYSYEVAETKSFQTNQLAKKNKYPLKTIIEEDT